MTWTDALAVVLVGAAFLFGRRRGYASGFIVGIMRGQDSVPGITEDERNKEYRRGWADREQLYNAMKADQ